MRSLEYKILVKNIGNAPSSDNVITTNVPQKVIVEETSISDSGIYNKKDNTITWRVDRIDIEEEFIVSYNAIAIKESDEKELIGNSNVTSQQMSSKVYSNNTIVSLDKIVEIIYNPVTGSNMIYIPNTNIGMPVSILFMIIIILSVTATTITIKIKKTNSIMLF